MKKYSAELISFGLLRNRFILGECRLVSGGNRTICMESGRFYSGRVSRVERGRGVLAGKGVL